MIIHGIKYNYSNITHEHIHGAKSRIPIICNKCNYNWNPTISDHINSRSRCPSCVGNAPWTIGRFLDKTEKIYGTKYDYSKILCSDIIGVESCIAIICNACNNSWKSTINGHINNRIECPHCSRPKGFSKKQIDWINSIMNNESIIIRYALSPEGEFKIPGVGKVDGYCSSSNTVYEYHGDFWHGNPSRYDPEEINPITKKSYGKLYEKTVLREQKIKDLGYHLIVKWETDIK